MILQVASPAYINAAGGHAKIFGAMRSIFCCLALVVILSSCGGKGASRLQAKSMKNPVEATAKSIASGKVFYDKYCASCHGATGKGDGEKASTLAADGLPKPSDLTDDKWDHGSTDGEIFVNIRDGVGVRGAMNGLDGRPGVGATDIWNIVNYVRTMKP
jgi:mono/diheme cytochrome c family protein